MMQVKPKPARSIQDFSLDKAERELIARALQESGWQKTKAAALLGITRATLYAKVKQHNIQRGTYIPKAPDDRPVWLNPNPQRWPDKPAPNPLHIQHQ